jgi:Fic family protein
MDYIENFQSGHFEKISGYSYFVPSQINKEWIWNVPELNSLLEKASVKLGELNSFSKLVPNSNLFIQMYVAKEAVISSRIEGTKTNMDEAFLPEFEIDMERRDDWKEVSNYIFALNYAIKELEKLPISSRLLRQTHKILLGGVRGESKLPGEFRRSQNWIGGNALSDAIFIPPHHHHLEQLMGDLENFLHNESLHTPALIRIAMAHYQFETIHPFLDGNGRIGRLLITLYLVSKNILNQPLLYLSHFFEKNKNLYYDNLTRVRTHNDMKQWLKYFLVGVEETAAMGVDTLMQVLQLKQTIETQIQKYMKRRTHNALNLLNHFFQKPVLSTQEAADVCKLSYKAASDLIKSFEDMAIIKEASGKSRNRFFIFDRYMKIF